MELMNSYEKIMNIRKTKFASAAAVAAKLAEFTVEVKDFFYKYRSIIAIEYHACRRLQIAKKIFKRIWGRL